MRIGLASDSFGNLDALERAFGIFERAQAEQIFFLGGRWGDVDAVLSRRRAAARGEAPPDALAFLAAVEGALSRTAGIGPDTLAGRIVRVASRTCPEYGSGVTKHVDLIEGRICCLVHDKAELTRDDISNASLIFHGNAPAAGLVQFGPRVFVTPGRLAAGGAPPTFALAEVEAGGMTLLVFDEGGAELRTDRATFGAGGKLSVR